MPTGMELLKSKRAELMKIADKYGVKNIRVFGSVARGEEGDDSDIDLLVSLEQKRDMFDLGGFQYTSSELLGRYVDVVMDNSMHPQMSESILKDATAI